MSNFQCPHCGMTNIDCGRNGYKTPREIELEKMLNECNKALNYILSSNGICHYSDETFKYNCKFIDICKTIDCSKYEEELNKAIERINNFNGD